MEQVSAEDRLYHRFQKLFGSTSPETKITDYNEVMAARATDHVKSDPIHERPGHRASFGRAEYGGRVTRNFQ